MCGSHIMAYVVSRWPFKAHALYQVSRRRFSIGRNGAGKICVRAVLFCCRQYHSISSPCSFSNHRLYV